MFIGRLFDIILFLDKIQDRFNFHNIMYLYKVNPFLKIILQALQPKSLFKRGKGACNPRKSTLLSSFFSFLKITHGTELEFDQNKTATKIEILITDIKSF